MKTIEIAFVGSINAGKTSLIKRCLSDSFEENSEKATIGIEFYTTILNIGNEAYRCNFVDTQGFDNNHGIIMIPQFKRFHGFIVVYDVSQSSSYNNSQRCFQQILENCQIENQNVAFVGNKIDLDRKITFTEANEYCLDKDIYYVETSAKNSNQIKKIIERIATALICSNKVKGAVNPTTKESVLVGKVKTAFELSAQRLKNIKNENCFKVFLKKLKPLYSWMYKG